MASFTNYCNVSILRTIQPYLALNSKNTPSVRVVQNSPISHFYAFKASLLKEKVIIVPDASIEVLFLCDDNNSRVYLYGSPLEAKKIEIKAGRYYFGMRFHPGEIPEFIDLEPRLLTSMHYDLQDILSGTHALLEKVVMARTFDEKVESVNHFFLNKIQTRTTSLANQIHLLITENQGILQMKDKERYLGFSSSYINRVFTENFGLSPKTYALILRFQNNLKKMLIEKTVALTDLASEQGYSDQSHFFREFKKFTTLAPSHFLKKVDTQDHFCNLF